MRQETNRPAYMLPRTGFAMTAAGRSVACGHDETSRNACTVHNEAAA